MSKELEKLKDISVSKLAGEVLDSVGVTFDELKDDFTNSKIASLFTNQDVFYGEYNDDNLNDAWEDVINTVNSEDIPDGGTFIIKVEWVPEK